MATNEYTAMHRLAYETVCEILDAKRDIVEPCMAHINEIRNSFNVELIEALRELCRRDILAVSLDINKNPLFTIKNPIQ